MESIARYLMLGGIVLFLIDGENGSFYFPLATSILVSVVLTIVLNFIQYLLKK